MLRAHQAATDNHLARLHQRLEPLQQLHNQYCAYQASFNKLVLEIARRRHYREAAETVIRGMMEQLEAMTAGEWEFGSLLSILAGVYSTVHRMWGAPVAGSYLLRVPCSVSSYTLLAR